MEIINMPIGELIPYEKNPRRNDKAVKPVKSKVHPTMKPIALCAKCIKNSCQQGEAVLDLFGGSGSTLIACEQINRQCYSMELDPVYCDVIVKRWEALTGRKAEVIGGA